MVIGQTLRLKADARTATAVSAAVQLASPARGKIKSLTFFGPILKPSRTEPTRAAEAACHLAGQLGGGLRPFPRSPGTSEVRKVPCTGAPQVPPVRYTTHPKSGP
jgi:hypothetical protein